MNVYNDCVESILGEFYEFLSYDNWHVLRSFKGKKNASLSTYLSRCAFYYFTKKKKTSREAAEFYSLESEEIIEQLNNLTNEEVKADLRVWKAFAKLNERDRNGKLLTSEKISSGYHLAVQPETILYTFNFPTANEIYRVRIVPLGLFGQSGVPMLEWIDCTVELPSQPTTPVAPEGKADIVDVKVVDGEIKNVSDSALTFERLGDATVANNSFSFIQNGNLKFDGFKNYYSTLANGFAATAVFTTGSDISTQQDIFGNKHAGGFGLSVQSGKLSFSVHLNGAYVSATVQVKANTTYHIVGVYDPTVGVILYVNGEMAAIAGAPSNATFGLPTVAGAQYLCIGADSNATGSGESFFKGSITSVAIYSAPLTYENALYLYQNK